ncbi:uncharacterized protein [Misgurnus anguillicaudatus]|uniref:uncharacterized protein n=1 Tax=Misgurnus anguillicaudatus TaxID=75329 RepID=UPI003CCF5425
MKSFDREDTDVMNIHTNDDNFNSHNDCRRTDDSDTARNQKFQHTGSERVRKRCCRSVTVCLVLLCVLLLTAVIVLCVLINTNNQQFDTKTENLTEERDQLLTKYTNITEERDQLLTKYTNITEERKQLLFKYINMTKENEKLLIKNNKQTEKINELWKTLNTSDGWIYYQSSLYFISSEQKSWYESRRYCRERGADLIIINNKEEQDFIKNAGIQHIWIGLSDSDDDGKWKWVDNSTLTTSFWKSGDPNNHGGNEDCVETESTGNTNQNVDKIQIQAMDKEGVEMIYANEDDVGTQTDLNTNRQQPLQCSGSERLKMRCYRSATLCLVLLCVLCMLINTNHQFNNKKLTEERLLTKYTNITKEKDQLLFTYKNMTKEKDELLIENSKQTEKIKELWRTLNASDGWIYYQSSLYYISSEKKSRSESRKYCKDRGADLIIINTKEEQDFIQKNYGNDKPWIGLTDSDKEGTWKWVDGSTLTSSFWRSGEPNSFGGDEDCVVFESTGWGDYPCFHNYKWICERKILK